MIVILNVYTPNTPQENKSFWKDVPTEAKKPGILKINMTGDFNLVEDVIDHLPSKHNNEHAIKELRNPKTNW